MSLNDTLIQKGTAKWWIEELRLAIEHRKRKRKNCAVPKASD